MTHRRLFLPDLTDQHLQWLLSAAILTPDGKTAKDWIRELEAGTLFLYEVPNGIIGVIQEPKQLFVEILAGDGMLPVRHEIMAALVEIAGGQPIEGFCVRPALARQYQRLGFTPTGTYMRFGDA